MSRPSRKLIALTLATALPIACKVSEDKAQRDIVTQTPAAEPVSAADETASMAGEKTPEPTKPAETKPAADPSPALSITTAPKDAKVGGVGGPIMVSEGATGTEDYTHYEANRMVAAAEDNLSTFSIDVDTASYSIVRRKIMDGAPVPRDAVRVEEFLNYFRYDYAGPTGDEPFAVHLEGAPSPFNPDRVLLRVGVQGKQIGKSQRKKAHLVFLVDVSGSMQSADKLPLAKQALRVLVNNLNDGDTVSLVTYAGSTRVVLPPTGLDRKAEIFQALDSLEAGGGTGMASGIDLAYAEAAKTQSADSETRVIILSDGDTNIGTTSWQEILDNVEGHRREGVTLSTVGFGMGNYKDTLMEQLADKGNGNYHYIDGISEARKVFQEQLGGTLEVIAKDVKIQVELDPSIVARYRLVGYENRDVADQDFRNDQVDAGEIGAGHSVIAMYELELVRDLEAPRLARPLATVRLRAKKPRGSEAAEWTFSIAHTELRKRFDDASTDFRFATAVMGAAEILRRSPYAGNWSLDRIRDLARATAGDRPDRRELVELLGRPVSLAAR